MFRSKVRLAGIAALGATIAMALAACGGSGGTAQRGGATTTTSAPGNATSGSITWWAAPIATSGADLRTTLIGEFEKAYPNIKVKLITAPNDTDTNRAALTTQISGGGGPDVYLGDVIWPAQFAAHELATNLSQYLPKSYFDTFAKGMIQGASYKGGVYAAPLFEDQGFLYYRKDLLKKYNLPVPTTWEQLVEESKQVQAKGDVKYGYVFQGADYEGATCDYVELLADAGGKVLNSEGTQSNLKGDAAVKALKFEQKLVAKGISPKASSTFQELQTVNAFDAGQSLFERNWDYAYGQAQASGSAVVGKVGIAPLPSFEGEATPGYSAIGGWNLYVNPHSKNVAAALTFVKWMTGKDAQTTLATKFSQIPTNAAVRSSSTVVSANPVMAAAAKTKLVSRPTQSENYPQVSQAIYDNVNGVLAGSLSPEAAIDKADDSIASAVNGGL